MSLFEEKIVSHACLEKCSEFIKGKAMFGPYPSQEDIYNLEDYGTRTFVDLTDPSSENLQEYKTKYAYIRYTIPDHQTPVDNFSYAKFIIDMCDRIDALAPGEKMYFHCKGGHGRSGMVVASIIAYYFRIHPNEALNLTSRYHASRPNIREKWKLMGSPHSSKQRDFVLSFFRQLKYGKDSKSNFTLSLDNSSPYEVTIPNVGTFRNAYFAFQYYKAPNNKEYVEELLRGNYRKELLEYDNKQLWQQNKNTYMHEILRYKFTQHPSLKRNLLNTGLRYFSKISSNNYWGGNGNVHGKILGLLREELYREVSVKN